MEVDPTLALSLAAQTNPESDPLRAAVIQVFDNSREALLRYLACLGLRSEEAEDVIQETFLRLHTHLRDGGRAENLRGWSFRVSHNLAVDLQKTRRFGGDVVLEKADPGPNPEEQLLDRERRHRFQAALGTLSPQQQHCLYLRTEGFGYREIGEILGISVSTVAEMLRRAIRKLSRNRDE